MPFSATRVDGQTGRRRGSSCDGDGVRRRILRRSRITARRWGPWGRLGAGFVVGTTLFSGRRAWFVYAVAVGHATARRRLPFELMPFLDDAHRLGLLRAVGPEYQFRHAEFQDHLVRTAGTRVERFV